MSADPKFEFDLAFQSKIVALFCRDTTFALRTKDLIKPEYFTEQATGALVRIMQEHVQVYKTVPDMKLLPTILKDEIAKKRLRPDVFEDMKDVIRGVMKADLSNPRFVSDKISDFARHQAMESAIMASVPLLEKAEFEKIGELMKQALAVGAIQEDDDYDYFAEIVNRTQMREDFNAGKMVKKGITTGYAGIDKELYHLGWGRKELSCVMGAAKSGKSLSLGDFTKNASLAGYNVLYASLEVSKTIISERIDAALSDTLMTNLNKDVTKVDAAIKSLAGGAGHFKMRDRPSGVMKPSHLHRMIENYRSDGIMLDLISVDYADIMASEYRSDNQQENLRTIYIDLRAIASEFNLAMLTATQTNRDGAKASTAKATDVGDDWNKARTVDILIGLNATDAEKAVGEARLYWALSRNTEDGFQVKIKQNRQKMQFITSVLGRVT